MSWFSSWGPTYEAKLGLLISAPGGKVLTAVPNSYGGISSSSGTSEAAPYVAGVAALIKSKFPNLRPQEILNRLTSTARPLRWQAFDEAPQDYLAPVFQQGAGLVDAWAAVTTKMTLNVSDLSFNDTTFRRPLGFEITNLDSVPVTCEISHNPSPTVYAFSKGTRSVTMFQPNSRFLDNVLPETHASLLISKSSFTVGPGESAIVTVTVATPPGRTSVRTITHQNEGLHPYATIIG